MIENDPIEELFRRKIDETIPQEKPREAVWQKIEKELEPKTKKPLKAFIDSVWFSAAVFALIAVPYFYFLIENMSKEEVTNSIVLEKVTLPEENEIELPHVDNEPIILDSALEIVKNIPQKVNDMVIKTHTTLKNTQSKDDLVVNNTDQILENSPLAVKISDSATIVKSAPVTIDKTQELNRLDTALYAANKSINTQAKKIEKKADESLAAPAPIAASAKVNSSITFYRNRFTLQAPINRASFEFVKRQNNKVTFQNNDYKIFITRHKGVVSVTANTDKIKSELLQLIVQNKESIFNYYINFPSPKNPK